MGNACERAKELLGAATNLARKLEDLRWVCSEDEWRRIEDECGDAEILIDDLIAVLKGVCREAEM